MDKTLTSAMHWRKSVKMFDAEKKVSTADVNDLVDTTILSPSSFGLEPWKIIVVSSDDLKVRLSAAGYNQKQFTTASHLVVMCVDTKVDVDYVDEMIARVCAVRNVSAQSMEEYAQMIKGIVGSKSEDEILQWSAHQVYLAMGVLLGAAAYKGIDASPMEGFDTEQFDKILDLESDHYRSLAVVALGYRSSQDQYVSWDKVRRDRADVVVEL